MKYLKCIIIMTFAGIVFSACRTTGQFSGTTELTVLLVDENGCGVGDCDIILSNFNKSVYGVTNKNGFCVFNNIPAGEYNLAGQKYGYTKLKPAKFDFNNKGDVFCFEILSSNFIFDTVEDLYEQSLYKNALELLDEIFCEKKTSLYSAVCLYKAYGFVLEQNNKAALLELKKMKKSEASFSSIYDKMVNMIELQQENDSEE